MLDENDIMSKVALEFLLYSYFGIKLEELGDKEIVKFAAINKAYGDMARHVLKIDGGNEGFRKKTTGLLMNVEFLEETTDSVIATIKGELEDYRMIVDGEERPITEGILQKWISMTYKYLCIINSIQFMVQDINNPYGKYIEDDRYSVPIDRFVLRAIGKENETSWSKEPKYETLLSMIKESNEFRGKQGIEKYEFENTLWIRESINEFDFRKRWKEYQSEKNSIIK